MACNNMWGQTVLTLAEMECSQKKTDKPLSKFQGLKYTESVEQFLWKYYYIQAMVFQINFSVDFFPLNNSSATTLNFQFHSFFFVFHSVIDRIWRRNLWPIWHFVRFIIHIFHKEVRFCLVNVFKKDDLIHIELYKW